ncbi:MAG: ABC transporter permease, partial [Actinobacteria bacterium]|nr:ABC transporter permease [Actinomycetota bacterium]
TIIFAPVEYIFLPEIVFLNIKSEIPAIIVTLGMLFAISGVTYLITMGSAIYPLPEKLVQFGNAKPLMTSWSFIVYIIIAIISDFILRKTIFGRKIYATGANIIVARINGINTDLVRISTHVFVSFLAGLAGIMFMLRIGKGTPNIGSGWEFPVIAGAIIGGVSLLGGYGTIAGAFLGVLIMQIIYNGLVIVGAKAELQNIVIGIIMIAAAGFDIWRRTKKSAKD